MKYVTEGDVLPFRGRAGTPSQPSRFFPGEEKAILELMSILKGSLGSISDIARISRNKETQKEIKKVSKLLAAAEFSWHNHVTKDLGL